MYPWLESGISTETHTLSKGSVQMKFKIRIGTFLDLLNTKEEYKLWTNSNYAKWLYMR